MSSENTLYLCRQVCPENLNSIPADAIPFQVTDSFVQLDQVDNVDTVMKSKCLVYKKFELDSDKEVIFSAGADWYFTAYLNGDEIFTTLPQGNGALFNVLTFSGQGKKGTNLLTIEVIRGRATSLFFFAECDFTFSSTPTQRFISMFSKLSSKTNSYPSLNSCIIVSPFGSFVLL